MLDLGPGPDATFAKAFKVVWGTIGQGLILKNAIPLTQSLKLYLQKFRDEGIFYEDATNAILDDLVAVVEPRRMRLVATFTARGGITTKVTAAFEADG